MLAPSLGGSLLSIFQSLPFIADGLSYLISVVCLSLGRTPFRQGERPEQTRRLLPEIIEGLRWLWRQPSIRRIAITAASLQLAISGLSLVVIVAARQAGASSVTIGILFSAVGVGGVLGAVLRPASSPGLAPGTFVPPFKLGRMTWIKSSFLWMMYRSGWATRPGQERVLAIQITRDGLEWALSHAALSHYEPGTHASQQQWAEQKLTSPVRIQWDPERSLTLQPLP